MHAGTKYFKKLNHQWMFWFHGKTNINENILPFLFQFGFKSLPSSLRINLPMRTHLMMEPPEKLGDPEKIFRIQENWFGNEQLTERNSKFSYLGKIHQSLRRFMGSVVVWPVKQGYLWGTNMDTLYTYSSGLDFEKIVKSDLKKKIVSKVIFFVIFLQSNHTHIYLINYIFHL